MYLICISHLDFFAINSAEWFKFFLSFYVKPKTKYASASWMSLTHIFIFSPSIQIKNNSYANVHKIWKIQFTTNATTISLFHTPPTSKYWNNPSYFCPKFLSKLKRKTLIFREIQMCDCHYIYNILLISYNYFVNKFCPNLFSLIR